MRNRTKRMRGKNVWKKRKRKREADKRTLLKRVACASVIPCVQESCCLGHCDGVWLFVSTDVSEELSCCELGELRAFSP
jgi:hypothetical protein